MLTLVIFLYLSLRETKCMPVCVKMLCPLEHVGLAILNNNV